MLRQSIASLFTTFLLVSPLAAQNSDVTVLHGIPNLGGPVDVFAGPTFLFTFDFGDQEGPLSLPPGPVLIDIRQGGTSLLSSNVNVPADESVSLIAHLDAAGTPVLSPFVNDTTPLGDDTRLTVRHTAQAGAVDIVLTQAGSTVTTLAGVTNGQEAVNDLPAGDYSAEIFASGTTTSVFGPARLSLESGVANAVFAVGVAGGPSFGVLNQRDVLSAKVTVVHGIAGLPSPVFVRDGATPLFSFDFGEIVGPLVLDPGTYNLNVQLNGMPVAGLTLNATLAAGDDVSIVAHPDHGGSNLLLTPFVNDTSGTGNLARVTARHVAAAPMVDVILERNGSTFATLPGLDNMPGLREGTADIGPGFFDLSIATSAGGTTVFGPGLFTPVVNTSTTFYAIGDFSRGTFQVVSTVADLSPAVPGDLAATPIGTGCGPTIAVSTPTPMFGSVFDLDLTGGMPNGMAMLNIGDSISSAPSISLPFDLGGLGAPGCFINANAIAVRPVGLDAMGNASVPILVPNITFGTLPTLYFQSATSSTANALGVVTSPALELLTN